MRRTASIALLVAASAALPATAEAKRHFLNAYHPSSRPNAAVVKTERLARSVPYKVAVRGTYSLFSREELAPGAFCGTTEPAPLYPSKGRPNGPVVADAEFLFADISRNCAKRPDIQTATVFQLKTGRYFRNREPIGGLGDAPSPDHLYTYAVNGTGRVARFRLKDDFSKDNYGRLKIRITRATAADCALNGFANWGYADEATCLLATAR